MTSFRLSLAQFTGPLDLLLHLIREQDIDIFDIPIAQITAQFLAAIEGVEALGIDKAGEFLEMAALLVRIKAQVLKNLGRLWIGHKGNGVDGTSHTHSDDKKKQPPFYRGNEGIPFNCLAYHF